MKNICYNKGTKRKKQTKNVSSFHKNGENTDAQIKVSRQEIGKEPQGRGKEIKERRVRKAMIPSHSEANA